MTDKQIETRLNELRDKASALNGGSSIGCWQYYTNEEKIESDELRCRRMVNSCLCYDNNLNGFWERYSADYVQRIGIDRVRKVAKEQEEFFKAHAHVKANVWEDSEGCTYNSISWN